MNRRIGTNSGSPGADARQRNPTHDRSAKIAPDENAVPPLRLEIRVSRLLSTHCPRAFICGFFPRYELKQLRGEDKRLLPPPMNLSNHFAQITKYGELFTKSWGSGGDKALAMAQPLTPRGCRSDNRGGAQRCAVRSRGVTLASNFLSGRLETDAIVLHCDERHQPCG